MISCILLSAGESSRFGSPKALVKLNETTIIEHLQNLLINSQVDEIITVLGASSDDIKPYLLKHKKVKFVYNKDYKLGQTSSFQAGLQAVSEDSEAFLLLPVDYPAIRQKTIDQLIEYFKKSHPLILIPTYGEKKGHPPIFDATLKEKILDLETSVGLNTIAHQHQDQTQTTPVKDPGVTLSFNTPDELAHIKNTLI